MQTVTIGSLNSEKGKIYAEVLNRGALKQIAEWCGYATKALEHGDAAEQADAALYLDMSCLARQLARYAG